MKRFTSAAIVIAVLAYVWYAFSPNGPLGYDEGVRLASYASSAADKLRRSSDDSATFNYSPKYGDDQAFSVEFTEDPSPVVVVHVSKGKSGAGYALGRSASVPRRLAASKAHGPLRVELRKEYGRVEVVGLE